jgi:predicted AAA+ superfamily ATPase
MIIKNGKRFGFEIKYSEAPPLTKSMLIALEDLKLDRITVIYPRKNKFKIHENIIVIGLEEYIKV